MAWGHTFPPLHTVVVQVERCEVALLIGYAAGTGDSTERIIARVASQPKSHAAGALRDTLIAYAMAPLGIAIDGKALQPTSVRAKIGFDASGTRPMVVVLATFPWRSGAELAIRSKDPRTTRISWQDRASGRIAVDSAPAQGRWFTGAAAFLLPLAAATEGSSCVRAGASDAAADSSPAPTAGLATALATSLAGPLAWGHTFPSSASASPQGDWLTGVASFLLPRAVAPGGSSCVRTGSAAFSADSSSALGESAR